MVIMHLIFTCLFYFFFFFKQKTAYEMRISDWSSDVCSSDLFGFVGGEKCSHRGDIGGLADAGRQRLTFAALDQVRILAQTVIHYRPGQDCVSADALAAVLGGATFGENDPPRLLNDLGSAVLGNGRASGGERGWSSGVD